MFVYGLRGWLFVVFYSKKQFSKIFFGLLPHEVLDFNDTRVSHSAMLNAGSALAVDLDPCV